MEDDGLDSSHFSLARERTWLPGTPIFPHPGDLLVTCAHPDPSHCFSASRAQQCPRTATSWPSYPWVCCFGFFPPYPLAPAQALTGAAEPAHRGSLNACRCPSKPTAISPPLEELSQSHHQSNTNQAIQKGHTFRWCPS
jgi:hypothetical protein